MYIVLLLFFLFLFLSQQLLVLFSVRRVLYGTAGASSCVWATNKSTNLSAVRINSFDSCSLSRGLMPIQDHRSALVVLRIYIYMYVYQA